MKSNRNKKNKKKENKKFPYKKGGKNRIFDEFGNIDKNKTKELNEALK